MQTINICLFHQEGLLTNSATRNWLNHLNSHIPQSSTVEFGPRQEIPEYSLIRRTKVNVIDHQMLIVKLQTKQPFNSLIGFKGAINFDQLRNKIISPFS